MNDQLMEKEYYKSSYHDLCLQAKRVKISSSLMKAMLWGSVFFMASSTEQLIDLNAEFNFKYISYISIVSAIYAASFIGIFIYHTFTLWQMYSTTDQSNTHETVVPRAPYSYLGYFLISVLIVVAFMLSISTFSAAMFSASSLALASGCIGINCLIRAKQFHNKAKSVKQSSIV